jgi:hypothetical protein
MDELSKYASASERHPAVVRGQEELAGVKSVQIKRNIKKNSENEFIITQSTRTEMVYDTVDQARSAYLDIHDAKEEAEFDESNSHKDEPSKKEPEQKTEEEMVKDQKEQTEHSASLNYGLKKSASTMFVVMLTNGSRMYGSNEFATYEEAKNAYDTDKQHVDAGDADRITLLQNDVTDKGTDIKILHSYDSGLGEYIMPDTPTKTAYWDADLIRQAAGAFNDINVDTGFYSGNIQPAVPHAGFNSQQKTQEYYPGSGDGYNIGVDPDKQLLGIHDRASAEEEVKDEKPGISLLQPDFKVSPAETELRNGVRREFEHTNDAAKAVEIALDHLAEDEKYYTKLQEVMPEFGTEEKKERDVYVKPDSKEVQEYDYEQAGKETMFPGVK